MLKLLPCVDSDAHAEARRSELQISHHRAAALGRSAVAAANDGYYLNASGQTVELHELLEEARTSVRSLGPEDPLPGFVRPRHAQTSVQVCNETTLGASRRWVNEGRRPLALNFANGQEPGGGLFHGALAQEEALCRSSALYLTLAEDPMYEAHQDRPESSDWAILSPQVPVFRDDKGNPLDPPWQLCFLTCAAPFVPNVGQPTSGDLLQKRIHRVLAIAQAFGYDDLVLGAWGCGAFENDPHRTAADFRQALETDFRGAFANIVFAIADWSPERRFLAPFRDVFSHPQ